MKLLKWQKLNNISNCGLAISVDVHPSLITHIHAGRRRPSPELAKKIEKATGGLVTFRELLLPDEQAN